MADRAKKFSELNPLTNALPADLLVVVNQPGTANVEVKKITLSNLFANVSTNTVIKTNLTANNFLFSNTTNAPANSTSVGTKGEFRVTNTHIYVCVEANTWVRASLSSW